MELHTPNLASLAEELDANATTWRGARHLRAIATTFGEEEGDAPQSSRLHGCTGAMGEGGTREEQGQQRERRGCSIRRRRDVRLPVQPPP